MLSQVVADLKNAFWPPAPAFSRELLSPAKLMRARERRPALSDYLPYCAYIEDEQIFVNQDSLGFCIELQPQGGANEDTAQILTALFSDSRVGAGIQFHLLASPHIQNLLRSYANLRVPDAVTGDGRPLGRAERQTNLYRTMARARAGFLMQGARHPLIPGQLLRDFRLVVSATLPGHVDDLSRREELIRMRDAMRTTFKAADFGSWTWDASALINWTSNLLNPQRIFNSSATAYYDDGRDLAAQIVDHDTVVRVTEQGLHFGKPASSEAIEARFLSVKHFPPHFGLWSMGTLIGDLFQSTLQYPCPFMITLGVHVLDPVATRNWASMKGTRAATNDKSVMARFQPEYHDQNDDWVMTLKALAEGQNLVDLYHEVALFAPPADITRAEESARAIWRSRGFELTNDTFVNTQALLASLPMTLSTRLYADLKKLKRVTTKTTTNAVHLAPLLGEWRGTNTPVLMLAGRRGQVIKLDVFDNNSGNYNVAIAGTSGSGKSVFLNEIAVSYLGCGAKVWIIDVGRSYEKTCRNFNGTFIEFTENNPISLNPFSSVVDINEDMAMLQPALVRMASPQEKLDNYLNACLGTAIKIAWNAKGRDMTVTDVHDLLASGRLDDPAAEPDRRLKDLAAMLRPYTRDGVYGRFFDGPATIDFSNDFVVLELEELKAKKDLQAVVLLIVMHRITQEMYFTRDRKKLLVIDEAWDLLGGDATAKFIETAYRRVRKYDGSVMSASQALDDYLKNDASMAALTNSDWLFFLRQKKESVEKLGELKRLAADEGMKRTLQSLRTEHGAYSEIFVSGPGGNGIGRLIVDPYSLLLYSSKAEDVSAIDAKRAQGLSLPEAIEAVLAERGPR